MFTLSFSDNIRVPVNKLDGNLLGKHEPTIWKPGTDIIQVAAVSAIDIFLSFPHYYL